MVIKLVANKFLSQYDFLIWEELLLCEKYIFWKLIENFVLFLDTTGCSSELIFENESLEYWGLFHQHFWKIIVVHFDLP